MDGTVPIQPDILAINRMPVREAANVYTRRNWWVVPVPFKSKGPLLKGWRQARIGLDQLVHHFNGHPQNIGVLLGEPSGWLVDIDVDHKRCVELADKFLPPTPAVFGRPSKPRSHRLFRVSAPMVSQKFKSKTHGTLIEIRSTRLQTVFPPSTHESGEPIRWEEYGEPLLIDPDTLLKAVRALADAVLDEWGEKPVPKSRRPRPIIRHSTVPGDPTSACVAAMLRMNMLDQNDGSSRLFAAACRLVEHDLSDADGIAAIREYARLRPFPANWTDQEILQRIRDAEQRTQRGKANKMISAKLDLPNVLIDTDEHRVVSQTISSLAADPETFQRGGSLVRVLRDQFPEDGVRRCRGSAIISALPQATLRERMTRFASFRRVGRGGEEVPAHPTPWLVAAVHARGEWQGIRHLNSISDVPILRPDGSIWQTPGYDSQTHVLYTPSVMLPPIPTHPTLDDADAAVQALLEIIIDFKLEREEHRAAWLTALLTPLARFAFDGPSPFFLIDANVRGAGKGLMAQTIGSLVLGREMPVSSYAHDSQEMRKLITTIAISGDRLIHLDNLVNHFGNDALDRALTSTRWKDRILGKSQDVELPLHAVWYGTGNNVIVAADTSRRIIHIRLDVLEERPEERTNFKHPNLIEWLMANRPQLLAHAFTILSAYCKAGRPTQKLIPFGSFEGWSALVREAVVWAGMCDPCRTRVEFTDSSDSTADSLRQLLRAWRAYGGIDQPVVVAELLSRLYRKDNPPVDEASVALRAALESFTSCPAGKNPVPRQLGNKLKSIRRRVIDGLYLNSNPEECHRSGVVWRLYAKAEVPNG